MSLSGNHNTLVLNASTNIDARLDSMLKNPGEINKNGVEIGYAPLGKPVTVISYLTSGGEGDVFWAEWQHGSVAIKRINLKLNREKWKSLKPESEILKQLTSMHAPYIVNYYFSNDVNDTYHYLGMEFMSGSLPDYIKEYPNVNWEQRKGIVRNIATAIEFLHSNGMQHNDLKASNVLVKLDRNTLPEFKLADFGFACTTRDAAAKELRVGTAHYLPPEIFFRFGFHNSPTVEMFSFATFTWEVADWRARAPYSHHCGRDAVSAEEALKFAQIAVPDGERLPIPKDCLPQLKAVMMLGWKEDPDERITAKQVLSILSDGVLSSKAKDFIAAATNLKIVPNSPEAYQYIRECFVRYSEKKTGNTIVTSVMAIFTSHYYAHHCADIALLLKKAKYLIFDETSLREFIQEAKETEAFKSIYINGEYFAILMVANKITNIKLDPVTLIPNENIRRLTFNQ